MYFTLKGGAGTQTVTDGAVSDGGLAAVFPNQLFNVWSYFREWIQNFSQKFPVSQGLSCSPESDADIHTQLLINRPTRAQPRARTF